MDRQQNNQQKIDEIYAAYEEFSQRLNKLKEEVDEIIKRELERIKKKKIREVLENIKKLKQ